LFLVFDLERRLLLPWVLSGVRTGFSGFFAFVLFLVVLVLGFVFEWQKGALDWTSKGSSTFFLLSKKIRSRRGRST
jgi:NADH:ubiquinone oxidoreductase subunit 3 (subunit A)